MIDGYDCIEKKVGLRRQNGKMLNVSILEATATTQEELVNVAIEASTDETAKDDPYGCVLWPAAATVSARLLELDLSNSTVLELGCGTGLVSLVAAIHGAKRVICTDYNPFSLALVEKAKYLQKYTFEMENLTTQVFDVKDNSMQLPSADIVVIADLLYDESLGLAVAQRIYECVQRKSKVIIADSPGRPGRPYMLRKLSTLLQSPSIDFKEVQGNTVTGFRHSLISNSATIQPESMPMGLLEL